MRAELPEAAVKNAVTMTILMAHRRIVIPPIPHGQMQTSVHLCNRGQNADLRFLPMKGQGAAFDKVTTTRTQAGNRVKSLTLITINGRKVSEAEEELRADALRRLF